MTKPITREEANQRRLESESYIPSAVIEIFNRELTIQSGTSGTIRIEQDNIVSQVARRLGVQRYEIFENHWLDIEEIYRKAGWDVVYNYNESTKAHWLFT
jgi:hypothetical protein